MDEQVRQQACARAAVLPFVCGMLAVVLSLRSLPELDLGWHLATGLWILDHQAFPDSDPFSALDTSWHAYSWLFELLLAVVFRSGGFVGLQVLQSLIVIASLGALLLSIRSVAQAGSMAELSATFVSFLLLSPFLYLRPHLLSVILLCALLVQLYHRRFRPILSVGMVVLWANIHVYWVFMPLLHGLDALCQRKPQRLGFAALLLLLGCVSPYGYHNLGVIWRYAVGHQVANELITEFQVLGRSHGMYLPLTMLAAAMLLIALFRFRRQLPQSLTLFSLLVILASFYQVKYLSLLAVMNGMAAAVPQAFTSNRCCKTLIWYASGALAAFVVALLLTSPAPALSPRQQQLGSIVDQLRDDASGIILNRFDDGGALALYLYLQESALRTSIDGRTLVMGAARLREYQALRSGSCEVLRRWNPRYAILEQGEEFEKLLHRDRCGAGWELKASKGDWRLFHRPQAYSRH